MTILIASAWDAKPWVDRFNALLPERGIVVLGEPFDRRAVHYVAAWAPPPGSLAGLPNLDVIFSLGAGVDHLMSDPRLPEDVPIVRVINPDLTTRMSEYVVLHCLAQLREHDLYTRQQRQKLWTRTSNPPAAADVRVGIMGMGVLGQDAARKLKTMGFDVAGWSQSGRPVDGIPMFAGREDLGSFLNRTDILVALLPLTEVTRGILNLDLFGQLARDGRLGGPVLINVGRGGLQKESDILAALDGGILKTAVLDVFETEPLPPESPLWAHPSVIVTPHNSAVSTPDATVRYIAESIRRYEAGEALQGMIDRGRGY